MVAAVASATAAAAATIATPVISAETASNSTFFGADFQPTLGGNSSTGSGSGNGNGNGGGSSSAQTSPTKPSASTAAAALAASARSFFAGGSGATGSAKATVSPPPVTASASSASTLQSLATSPLPGLASPLQQATPTQTTSAHVLAAGGPPPPVFGKALPAAESADVSTTTLGSRGLSRTSLGASTTVGINGGVGGSSNSGSSGSGVAIAGSTGIGGLLGSGATRIALPTGFNPVLALEQLEKRDEFVHAALAGPVSLAGAVALTKTCPPPSPASFATAVQFDLVSLACIIAELYVLEPVRLWAVRLAAGPDLATQQQAVASACAQHTSLLPSHVRSCVLRLLQLSKASATEVRTSSLV
jgi:hypothetical protein